MSNRFQALLLSVLALLGALAAPNTAWAEVTCQLDSYTPMEFGRPGNPIGPVPTTSTVQVSCRSNTASDVGSTALVCIGANTPNTPRRMVRRGNQYLYYDIFSDPARTQRVDFIYNASAAVTVGAVGNWVPGTVILYGRLASPQTPSNTGNYSETVTGVWGYSTAPGSNCTTVPQASPNFTFVTSAALYGSCSITANNLNFGNTTNLNTAVVGSSAVSVTCTNGTLYRVSLNGGTGGTIANRRMRLNGTGPASVGYNLYLDSGYSQLWGDGSNGALATGIGAGSGSGTPQSIAVHGRVPADPTATTTGSYTDTVTATVEY